MGSWDLAFFIVTKLIPDCEKSRISDIENYVAEGRYILCNQKEDPTM